MASNCCWMGAGPQGAGRGRCGDAGLRGRCRLIASDRARLAGVRGAACTLGQKAGVSEPFGNEVQSGAVDGQAGYEAEGSSVLQFLLVHGDEKEVVAV